MLGGGEQVDCFDFAVDIAVENFDGAFELHIFGVAKTADNVGGVVSFAELNGEPFVGLDPYARLFSEGVLDKASAVFDAEKSCFFGINSNTYNYDIEYGKCSTHYHLVPNCKGIKRPWKDCYLILLTDHISNF